MKLNANYIISRILIGFGIIFLLTLFGIRDVKAETIPAPNTFDTYNSNGSYNTYSSQLYSSWWWGYNLYSVSGNTGFSSPRQDYVWTNFRQYCNDVLNLSGSFTSLYYDEVYDKFNVYIYNGGKGNLCSTRYDTSSHLVYFDCSITMSNSNSVALSIQNKTGNEFLPHGLYVGLITTSQYSCSLDASSIINNQNNNTQTIINNNNNNTNQIINNQNQNADKINDSINDVNDSITDSNVDSSSTSNFFNNFQDNDHGLSGIVSSPLRLVKAFTSNTCNPAKFTIFDKDVELPCSSILTSRQDFKPFYNVYNIIMGGLISYGCLIGIRKKVDDFKNPDDSKVEVMDL